MPRTVSFPNPSPHVCPVCDQPLTGVPCTTCGAQLGRPEAAELLQIDRRLHQLGLERGGIVERLLTETASASPAPTPPPPLAPPPPPPAGGSRAGGWSIAEMLVGLGGLSLVAAVAVFVAVAWSDLAAWLQGGLLLTATGTTVAVASTARRRGLTATAESLGVVAVALGLADVEVARTALDGMVTARATWTVGLTVLAVASVAAGRSFRLRGMTVAGVMLAFVPATVALTGSGPLSHVAWALVAQAALGVAAGAWLRRPAERADDARILAAVFDTGAAASAVGAASIAISIGLDDRWLDQPAVSPAAVGILLALAGVAVGGAVLARWREQVTGLVLAAGALTVLVAAGFSAPLSDDGAVVTVVLLTAAAVAMACSAFIRLDGKRPWAVPMGAVGGVAAMVALVPLLSIAAIVVALASVAVSEVDVAASTTYLDHLRSSSVATEELPTASVFPRLLAVAAIGGAAAAAGRWWGRPAIAVAGVAALVAAPVVTSASIGTTVLGYAAAWAAVVAWQLGRPDHGAGAVVLAVVGGLFAGVALAVPTTTVVATVALASGLGAVSIRSLRIGAGSTSLWVAGSLSVGLGGVAVDALRIGSGGSAPALLTAAAAAFASLAGPAIERWHRDDLTGAAAGADVVVGAALVLAALATRSVDAASAVVATIAAVAGLHALRPTRRPLVGVALGATVALVWLRLSAADIVVLEAYSLPLAGTLLLGGALADPETRSSWTRNGAGLFAALGPSAGVALVDGDVVRTVAVVLGAGLTVLWGAIEREQAPLAIGGVVLSAVALRHLGPVAEELPRYVVFAVVGVGLLAAGATFERRRRDLRRAREAFGRLA